MKEKMERKKNALLILSSIGGIALAALIIFMLEYALNRTVSKRVEKPRAPVTEKVKKGGLKMVIRDAGVIRETLGAGKEIETSSSLTLDELRQKQYEGLKEAIREDGPTAKPGKYPTAEEMEEMEKSGAMMY